MNDWQSVCIGDIAYIPRKQPIANPQAIELLTVRLYAKGVERTGKYPRATERGRPYFTRDAGEILIGRQNFHNGGVGVVSTADHGLICSNAITSLIPAENADRDFLFYHLSNTEFRNSIQKQSEGTGQSEISETKILSLEVTIPPLPEQKKIAQILSGIDKAIESLGEEIAKASAIHSIACQQKIADLSLKTEMTTIRSISNKIIDYRGKSPPKHETGVPLITAKNIRKGFIDMNPAEFIQEDLYAEWMAKGIPSSGDILVTTEAPLGNVAIAPPIKFAIGQRVICISPDRNSVTSEYLLACMKTDDFQRQLTASATGSTVSGIRQGVLLDSRIPVPGIELQRMIGSFDFYASKLINALTAKRAKLASLKQSLASDLLTGRKRVTV